MEENTNSRQEEGTRKRPRMFVGTVKSDKMQNSVVVEVTEKKRHPVYGKYVSRRKRYLAEDRRNEYQQGDVVRIRSAGPLSSKKRWAVHELVERPK